MCLYPKIIRNKKFTENKKNGGVIPTVVDTRTLSVPVKCGKCIECRKQYAREWQIRITEDIKTNTNGKFITLTFRNEEYTKLAKEYPKIKGYALDNQIATRAVRLFTERWRKKYGKTIRHWLITELGQNNTEHLHLHGIVWADDLKEVERIWGYGYVWKGKEYRGQLINYVNEATANYITKYITKKDMLHKEYKAIILCSKGIGRNYIETLNANKNKYNEEETRETYITRTGHKISLPIYWRNKIYTEEEKEKLWIQKLDKNERYVLGKKIDISKTEDEYWEAVQEARKLNIELGYGGSMTNKEQQEYEYQRRIIKQEERRIKNASGGDNSRIMDNALKGRSASQTKETQINNTRTGEQ